MVRASVHWNFHKNRYSVVVGGRVRKHAEEFHLRDVRFCVGKKGRKRVLREQVKNVHARIRGTLQEPSSRSLRGWRRVAYDPYRWPSFVTTCDERPIEGALDVIGRVVDGKACVYARGITYAPVQ